MSLTTDPAIGDYQLSRSEMWIGLTTDAYVISAGAYSKSKLSPSGSNVVGGTFEFVFNGITVLLTIVSGTPDYDNNEVSEKAALSDSDYAALLVDDFNKNYLLTKYFIITQSTDKVLFQSIELSSDFDLTSGSTLTDTGTALATQAVLLPGGADPEYAPNYKARLEVFMESYNGANDFSLIGSQELDPDEDNLCIFDIRRMVDANLEYRLPTLDLSTGEENTLTVKRFYLKYLEKFGSPVEYKQVHKTTQWPALKAGFNFLQETSVTEAISNFYIVKKIFNTRQPRIKTISENQREYLHIFGPDPVTYLGSKTDISNLRARLVLYPLNGSDPQTLTGTPVTVSARKFYCFASGYKLLKSLIDTSDLEFEDINYFTFELIGNNNSDIYVSERFTYYCDQDFYLDENIYYFSNSDGGIDTFRATGRRIETENHSGETYTTRLEYGRSIEDGEIQEVNKEKNHSAVQNTGFINKDVNAWLSDLFLAEQRWHEQNDVRVPMMITSAQKPFDETQKGKFNFDFEYKYSFSDIVTSSPNWPEEEGS